MKNTQTGNCPYCDAERGIQTMWGMGPQGWADLKERHDAGHPENTATVEPKKESCPQCGGDGWINIKGGEIADCPTCKPTPKKPIHSLPEKIDLGEVIKGVDKEQQPRELFNALENTLNSIIDWLQAEKEL